jgi:hypothetical protein
LSESDFKLFWERIEIYNRKNLVLLLVGANGGEPVPSRDHLAAELFLVERCLGVDNGAIVGDKLRFKRVLSLTVGFLPQTL